MHQVHLLLTESESLPKQLPNTRELSSFVLFINKQEDTPGAGRQVLVLIIQHWEKVLILAILIVLIVLVSVKGFTVFGDILTWFQKQNNWAGWAIFLAMYTANVSLLLPGIVLILGSGFVFGFWKGLLAVWIGGGIGQSMAFLLARYLIGDLVSAMLRGKSKKWDMVDRAIETEGWKLLLLCRLSPVIPYNVLNVLMASTKIHFWPFALVSFFGIIPECSLFCYMGSLTENVSAIVAGDARPHGKVTYILAGVSVFFLLLTACWATLIIRRALKRADASLKEESAAAEGSGDDVEAGVVHTLLPQAGLQSPDAAARSDAGQRAKEPGWPYSPPSLRGKDAWQAPPSPHSDNSDPWDEELRPWPPSMQEDSAPDFLLFPTSFHADGQLLKEAAAPHYSKELTFDPKNKPDVTLKYRATITGTWTTFEAGVVEALTAHHILGPDFLEK
ncbi:hypothetical protein WJX75_008942 [Coccomyxa subellipsoidea]|uniref:VTT domain-containing protein n=1 Tax=Coccomyxa subellipsoidea TaxID=248742 RepID=A0ABR2YQ93_9CHLO